MKKYESNQQVYITLGGDKDGVIIQTAFATFMAYYRLLGYELIGKAQELPLEVLA